ncbi:MAG: O-antigen ligase family protein [Fimbriimonas sp.]
MSISTSAISASNRSKPAGDSTDWTSIILLHATLCLMICLPSVALAAGTYVRSSSTTAMAALVLLGTIPGLALYLRGRVKIPLSATDFVVWFIVVLGMIGIVITISGGTEATGRSIGLSWMTGAKSGYEQVGYFASFVLRNLTLYYWLSRSRIALNYRLDRSVLIWILITTTLINFGSLGVAIREHTTLGSSTRLSDNVDYWMTINHVGQFGSFAFLVSLLSKSVPKIIRIGCGGLGLYILLLTQARMTIIATFVTVLILATVYLIIHRELWSKVLIFGFGTIFILAVTLPAMMPAIVEIPAIKKTIERSTDDDPTTGRGETFRAAWEHITTSPYYGHGWNSDGSRFEQGMLSLGVEVGVLGVFAYGILTLLAFGVAAKLLFNPDFAEHRHMGYALLVFLVFLLFRGIGERNHLFQTTTAGANGSFILLGYGYTVIHATSVARKVARQKESKLAGGQAILSSG